MYKIYSIRPQWLKKCKALLYATAKITKTYSIHLYHPILETCLQVCNNYNTGWEATMRVEIGKGCSILGPGIPYQELTSKFLNQVVSKAYIVC